jgi:hypothetical protein
MLVRAIQAHLIAIDLQMWLGLTSWARWAAREMEGPNFAKVKFRFACERVMNHDGMSSSASFQKSRGSDWALITIIITGRSFVALDDQTKAGLH